MQPTKQDKQTAVWQFRDPEDGSQVTIIYDLSTKSLNGTFDSDHTRGPLTNRALRDYVNRADLRLHNGKMPEIPDDEPF